MVVRRAWPGRGAWCAWCALVGLVGLVGRLRGGAPPGGGAPCLALALVGRLPGGLAACGLFYQLVYTVIYLYLAHYAL